MKTNSIILFLQGWVIQLAVCRLDLTVTESKCGDSYNMEHIKEAYVTFGGENLKRDCSLRFTNYYTSSKQTCFKPLRLELSSCSTTVEYRMHFIYEYLNPSVTLSCETLSKEEWCGSSGTTKLYVVFQTSERSASDSVYLHVYLKDLSKDHDPWDTDTGTDSVAGVVAGTVIGVVLFIIFTVAFIAYKRRMAPTNMTPHIYQTTSPPSNMQTENMVPAQPLIGNQPPQQYPQPYPPQPTAPENYQMHPMQTAYPVPAQQGHNQGTGVQQFGFGHQGTGPTNTSADPPPSYESLTK